MSAALTWTPLYRVGSGLRFVFSGLLPVFPPGSTDTQGKIKMFVISSSANKKTFNRKCFCIIFMHNISFYVMQFSIKSVSQQEKSKNITINLFQI